jgi:hypothetical protein
MALTSKETRRSRWKICIALLIAWIALNMLVAGPARRRHSVSEQKATGLAVHDGEAGFDPEHMWGQTSISDLLNRPRARYQPAGFHYEPPDHAGGTPRDADKFPETAPKIIHTSALEMEVKNPAECTENIRELAERLGGSMASSEVRGTDGAGIVVRIPTARFEEARTAIRRLALRVDSEKADAGDVTRDYADRQARLRNLRAQEEQYLAILRHAASITDTLAVTAKINEMRGDIEKDQAEFATLGRQIATVAITVTLRTEAEARVMGIHWRPLLELKLAMQDGLESLTDYLGVIMATLFRLPAVILWLATITWIMVIGRRIARWVWRRFFVVEAHST